MQRLVGVGKMHSEKGTRLTYCIISALIYISVVLCIHDGRHLRIGETLFGQVLQHGQRRIYHLHGLEINSSYEVRVSYPAVIPAFFAIRVINVLEHQKRSLLNVDKTVFQTTRATENYYAEVIAYRTGVPMDEGRLSDPVVFNLVLEKLHFGLTSESWKLGLIGLVILFAAWFFFVPSLSVVCRVLIHRCHPHKS